jgi:hypothetical protein
VEHPGGRLFAEPVPHAVDHVVHVGYEIRHIVMGDVVMTRVVSVIALIVEHHIVAVGQQSPERIIGIDRKTVAMGEDQSRALNVAMAADADDSTVFHGEVENFMRGGNCKICHGKIVGDQDSHGNCRGNPDRG